MFLKKLLMLSTILIFASSMSLHVNADGPNRAVQGSGGMVNAKNPTGMTLNGIFGQLAVTVLKRSSNDSVIQLHQGFWVLQDSVIVVDVQNDFVEDRTLSNYPNPFSNSTTIRYVVDQPGEVVIRILDMMGNEIMVFNQGFQQEGQYQISWNAKNLSGDEMSSGTYLYEFRLNSKGHNSRGNVKSLRNIMVLVK